MYVFRRVTTISNAANTTKAIGFAMELTGYISKTYGINLRLGMEMFGSLNLHWQFETDSLDKITVIQQKMMEDKNYWSMLEKGKEYWLEGSLKDSIIMYPN